MELALQRTILIMLILIFLYLVRPSSFLHRIPMNQLHRKEWGICFFTAAVTCLVASYGCGVSDWWSDKGPDYQFQYEKMTQAILDGHLYLDIEVSPELAALENPYDPFQRNEAGASFSWDHAFYQGHYYMYFGVVPVFLLFLPCKLIGVTLLSYQATRIFVLGIIIGMFAVFYEIVKKMCPQMPLSSYLAVSVASAWISVWYAVKYPALYCTAISGGVCLAVWGFFFCLKGFVTASHSKNAAIYVVVGALCSALTFGCRPTIGLFCICLLPLLYENYRKCENKKEFVRKLGWFCIPFIVVAILLMLYNDARFDSPFEFGQSYQLTTVDQHDYKEYKFKLHQYLNGILFHFVNYEEVSELFPFLHHDGCLILFPVLFLGVWSFGTGRKKEENMHRIAGLPQTIVMAILAIIFYHVTWAPIMFRRYSMDFYFLLGFLTMLGACCKMRNAERPEKNAYIITLLGAYACVICFLLFFVAYDYSIADLQPEIVERVKNVVMFWKI